ncbi:collagen binding domain-containing protein [Solibacillus cecembensis]|uniref:collagen binding domain-containing protein n=1 Tax=Solibacillus cecembensis TaxID=459347 RepID=UPI003D020318
MKKLNIAVLTVLLVFQTLLSPLATYASETEALPPDNNAGEQSGATNEGSGDDGAMEGAGDALDQGIAPISGMQSTSGDTGGAALLNVAKEILDAKLSSFNMKIDGQPVGEGKFPTELEQNTTADFEVTFTVPLQDVDGEAWVDSSWFEFQLPNSLIDFDGAFHGSKTVDDITYTYTTTGNNVRVELSGMEPGSGSSVPAILTINFSSGFNKLLDDIEQELEIPSATDGSQNIKAEFTFKPSTSNEKAKKKSIGTPTLTNGNHQMEWEVWVNEAGKKLSNATLTDNATGGHVIVADSVNVYEYTVGLNGVKDPTSSGNQVLTDRNWSDVNSTFTDGERNAYKITYKTEVSLDADQRDGAKDFYNTVTFTNDGTPETSNSDVKHIVTYGKALDKHDATGDNYTKNWRIDYNHNLLNIDEADATLEDTISGPHEIDIDSIKVYKMSDTDGDVSTTVPGEGEVLNYTVTPSTGDSKTFKLSFDGDISDAYTVTYESKYDAKDFIEDSDITGQILNNTVTNGIGKSNPGSYTLTENLLKKTRVINVDDKLITWTIDITSDNPDKAITNLTLTDTFINGTKNGKHTLVAGSVKIDDIVQVDGQNGYTPDPDPTKGFVITGINVPAGKTVKVTYTTNFDIGDTGIVATQGYGNTANTTWTSGGVTYDKTKTAEYIPSETTINNGSKSGKFDYSTREFTWDVRVNINKKDIQGAVLVDTVGDGHKYVPGTIEVLPLKGFGSDDTGGTIGTTPIDASNYTITNEFDTGFTLTFNSIIDSVLNNEAYVVRYNTVDSDVILGIGSTNEQDAGNVYKNEATFKTKGTQSFTLKSTPVTIIKDVANNLITKREPNQNSQTEKITWTLDVNKSHSNLGINVELTDLPGNNLMLLEDSIQIATYKVTAGGISNNADWQTLVQRNIPVTFATDGSFKLTFPSLENVGYQVKYETIGFGKKDDALENTATLHYTGQTEANQKIEDKYSGAFKFSSSDSNFTSTRGSVKFKKVGIDSATGLVKDEALPGVEFQLVRKTAKNEYIIKTATTDANGEITFERVPYNDYLIREVKAPTGYDKMKDLKFTLDETTTLDKNPDLVEPLINTTPITGSCTQFKVTVKDVDGELVTSGTVTLTDKNGKTIDIPVDSSGIAKLPVKFQAGEYKVEHSTEGKLSNITVKYDGDCEGTVQPAPSCDKFTIVVMDGSNIRKDITELTLKQGTTEIKAVPTADGKFEFDSNRVQPIEYDVYEGKQYLGKVKLSYKENCSHEFTVIQAPACPDFTLTVKDVDGNLVADGTKVTVEQADGTVVVTDVLTTKGVITLGDGTVAGGLKGEYTVKVDGADVNFTATFNTNADCAVTVFPTPSCPQFILTVKNENGPLAKDTVVILTNTTDSSTQEATVGEDGIVKLANTTPPGKYNVKVKESNKDLGEFDLSYKDGKCEAEVGPNNTCPQFTITVKDVDGILVDESVTLIHEDDTSITITETTDKDGKIIIPPTSKAGNYKVYDRNDSYIGTVEVDYVDNCEAEVVPANVCSIFTLTIKDQNGKPRSNVALTIKDKTGNTTIGTGTTDAQGQMTVPYALENGVEYQVYEGVNLLTTITVKDCAAAYQPTPPVSPPTYPWNPTEPNNPDPKPEDPNNPNKPGSEDPKPEDPNNPNKPGSEDPKPEDPNNPNKPGGEDPKPEDPNKPGSEDPKPEDPNNPNKPGSENPKPVNPTNPTNPGTTTPPTLPGLEGVIKTIPPAILPTPGNPLTPGELAGLVEKYSKDPSKLDALVNDLKGLVDYYESLSAEQKAEFEELYDVNSLNMMLDELDKVASLQMKLPQTDGASQFGMMLVGSALLLAGAWLFVTRRRKA